LLRSPHRCPLRADFAGRRGRGASDLVNSLLNYGYGILYNRVLSAATRVGLDPFAAYVHTDRPRAPHGSFEDLDAACPQMLDDLDHRCVREEAQVGRARGRHGRLGFELPARLVEVDLLCAKR